MKLFFDTEFTGLHKNTTLISIGIVAEDGRQFYAELNDYDRKQCTNWIEDNVITNLHYKKGCETYIENYYYGDSENVRVMLKNWLSQFEHIQFVSDVCHYDFVLLIELLSTMALWLPKNISSVCHDINQDIAKYFGISETAAFDLSREKILLESGVSLPMGEKHNALYDAKVIRDIYMLMNNG